jgi:L-lactate dehydrogenase complex protein LldG
MTGAERVKMRDTLRAAVGQALLPGAELQHPGSFRQPAGEAYDLVERFHAELTTLGGTVHEAADAAGVAMVIGTLVAGQSNPKALMWDEHHLPVAGLGAALRAAGIVVLTQAAESAHLDGHRRELATAAVGITGADAGLAETGSVVVSSGPGRGRLASLLPPLHVALLRRGQIVPSLPHLIAERPELVTSGANFVCITGPSRTADIEHVLARGVHGPKEVHVILMD